MKVLTGNGEYNLQDSSDRTSIWVSLLCAEFEQGIRNRKITDAAIDILKRGGIPHKPPFGCERIDSEVRLKDGYKEVIRLVFETFIQKKSYQGTARIVNEKYGEDMGFELDRDAVARIVTNTIYTGFVYWDGMYFGQDGSSDKPNEDLRAVDEETFERAQAVVAEIAQKYSRNPGPSHRVRQLAIEHGADVVLENLNVRVSCPKCDSTDLQHNGQDNIIINGTLAWKFKCKNCPHSFRFPAAKQLKQLASLNPLRCMKCGSADKFAVEKEEGGERLTCEECGFSVFLEGDNEHVPERKPINNNETEKDSASSDKGEKIKANTASKDNQTPNNNSDRDQITNTTLELFFE